MAAHTFATFPPCGAFRQFGRVFPLFLCQALRVSCLNDRLRLPQLRETFLAPGDLFGNLQGLRQGLTVRFLGQGIRVCTSRSSSAISSAARP